MPHVEVTGRIPLEAFHARFAPRTLQDGPTVLKTLASFLAHDGRSLLLECMAVEGYLRQGFFVLVSVRSGGALVRLHPRSAVEKSEGVKRLLAWTARRLEAEAGPGAAIGTTNLADQLARPLPPEALRP